MANSTERIGVYHCGEIAESNNWMFREQPINDIGIDAHMEFVDSSGKPKQLLALQIKTGESWFKEQNDGCVIFRGINERQYLYWTTNSLPCIVVLYNPKNNTCIWQKLTSETIEKTNDGKGKGFSVRVPLTQVFLNNLSNEQLLSYTNLPEHIVNYNFLLSQKEFMQIIQDGGEVKLHSSEWVNKSSGKGKTELIVYDGKSTKRYSYPYWFPYTPYAEVFPRLFPWAKFSVDEEFYEESDEAIWRELHCYYDKEDDQWLVVGDSFEDFRKKLDPMRSIDNSGEVAEYMLVLSLNDLGKSFLKVDEFVTKNQAYAGTNRKENEILEAKVKKIKLNENFEKITSNDEYELDPTEKYEIDLEEELDYQSAIFSSFQIMGAPPALKNYHAWLFENDFNVDSPNPTNEFVASYYGVKPLWKTDYSQGIVVRNENDSDYYIVMECSNKNKGYKHTKVILTPGGCI